LSLRARESEGAQKQKGEQTRAKGEKGSVGGQRAEKPDETIAHAEEEG